VSNRTRGLIEQVQLRFILGEGLDDFQKRFIDSTAVETGSVLVLGKPSCSNFPRLTSCRQKSARVPLSVTCRENGKCQNQPQWGPQRMSQLFFAAWALVVSFYLGHS
jgi:hypothetical protein